MAYDNPEAFGKFHLYNRVGLDQREIGSYGKQILTLVESPEAGANVPALYQRLLGVLGMHGTEVGRARVIHGRGREARTVMAEHVFYLPWQDHQDTVLVSMGGDSEVHQTNNGERVTYDYKSSEQRRGPEGEIALQYDGLVEPPVLRVIDVQGADQQGMPQSELSDVLLSELRASVATQ